MSNENPPNDLRESIVRKRDYHRAEAARLERELADIDRLASLADAYGFLLTPAKKEAPSIRTLSDLIDAYRRDERSRYHKLRFSSRESYDHWLQHWNQEHGPRELSEFTDAEIQKIYAAYTNGGQERLSSGHSLITMLRGLANYGASVLQDRTCREVAAALHRSKFVKATPKRLITLTEEHVRLIIEKSNDVGRPSIGLAQAFQYELDLPQKDVIGEWLPVSEQSALSDVIHDEFKWTRGLRWEEIDSDLVLRHVSMWPTKKKYEVPLLKRTPLAAKQLERMFVPDGGRLERARLRERGPMIVSEFHKRPWPNDEYRRQWRIIADAVGVPKEVRNSDSRARKTNSQKIDDDDIEVELGLGERPSLTR